MRIVSVGADLGGTWLRVSAVDRRGRPRREKKFPARPPLEAAAFLRRLWKGWALGREVSLVVGSRGVGKASARRALTAALRGLSDRILVMTDAELAHRAVLGGEGVLILAGTGSIAFGLDGGGRWSRAGGHGPQRGDEGSGFWIGREFLRRTGRPLRPLTPRVVRETAALSRKVLSGASRDPLRAKIVRDAQEHLAGLAGSLLRKNPPGRAARVGWVGGLLENGSFRRGFFRRLRAAAPGRRFRVVPPRRPNARAAALLGLWRK